MNKRLTTGFSLIELLVSLAILGILLSVAVPSFSVLLAEQRLRAVSTELRMSLTVARSEAVKRNSAVNLFERGGDWSNGWCVEPRADAAGTLITACTAAPISEYVVNSRVAITGGSSVSFNAWGRAAGCPQFEISTTSGDDACTVCLTVEPDGRVLSATGECGSCPTGGTEAAWSGACN